jgi:hypothetical protein
MVEEKERDIVEEISREKKKNIKNKWLPYTFGPEPLNLVPYEVNPVTDIPIRLAVDRGVIPRKRDLALYRTTEDWNGHPRRSIVIAGPIEEGQPFAVWIGDDSYSPPAPGTEVAKIRKVEEKPDIAPIVLPPLKSKETATPIVVRLNRPLRNLFGPIRAAQPERLPQVRRFAALFEKTRPAQRAKSKRAQSPKAFLSLK